MSTCSILVKDKNKKTKHVCRKKPMRWIQMGVLGEMPDENTPCIHLCMFHASKVYKWGFRE